MFTKKDQAVPGEIIRLGGVDVELPPLPLIKMSALPKLLTGGNVQDEGYVQAFTDAIFYSLQRNYLDLKIDDVRDNIDMTNFNDILTAFSKVNNFVENKNGETEVGKQKAG